MFPFLRKSAQTLHFLIILNIATSISTIILVDLILVFFSENVNRKMKKIWKEKLGRGGAPAHGSKSELVGLVVLVLSLLLLLVLSILAIGLVLTILAAGLHLVRILILHQAHLAFADCSVPGKNKIIRKFFSQMGIPRAALLCYNEPS